MLPKQILDTLVDPEDKGSLFYIESENLLYNPRLKRSYAVMRQIPIMLTTDATTVTDAQHAKLMKEVQRSELKPTGSGK